jgi:hypothetical protein
MTMTDAEILAQAEREIREEFFKHLSDADWDARDKWPISVKVVVAERSKVIRLQQQSRLADLMANGSVMSLVETIQLRVSYGYYVRFWRLGEIIEKRCISISELIAELSKVAGE